MTTIALSGKDKIICLLQQTKLEFSQKHSLYMEESIEDYLLIIPHEHFKL